MLEKLTPPQRRFVIGWVAGLAVLFLVLTLLAIRVVGGEKRAADARHAARMSAEAVEPGHTPPDPIPAGGDFVEVAVGIYLDNIDAMSIKDSSWSGTFYVWFRWSGDRALDPARGFQIIDGRIDRREIVEDVTGADGVHYQRARVTAKFSKYFNTTRVPLDDHMMTIRIEDTTRDVTQLRYAADPASNISSRAKIPGYVVGPYEHVVKGHTYRSSYGDPRFDSAPRKTFSEYTFGIPIHRATVGLYVKLLIGLFAGTLLTLVSFYLRPTDGPRLGFPSTSYFGAVANSYLISSMLPPTGEFGLVDYVTGLGFFTITMCLVTTLISWYQYVIKEQQDFSKAIDVATRRVVFALYLTANIAIPASAVAGR